MPGDVRRPRFDPAGSRPGSCIWAAARSTARTRPSTPRTCSTARWAWGIVGVSLQGAGVRDRLKPQDGLYTVLERTGRARRTVIGTLREVLFAPGIPAR